MKRIPFLGTLALALLPLGVVAEVDGVQNGAEKRALKDGWFGTPGAGVAQDPEITKEGQASYRLRSDGAKTTLFQIVKGVKKQDSLRLESYVKTMDAGRAGIEIAFYNADGRRMETLQSDKAVTGTTFEEDWESLVLEARPPDGAVEAQIRVFLEAGGTAWFDGIRLTRSKRGEKADNEIVRPASLKEENFTARLAHFKSGDTASLSPWRVSQAGLPEGYTPAGFALGQKGLFVSKDHLPESVAHFRLRIIGTHTTGIGFGFRAGYGKRPRITLSSEGQKGLLSPIIEDETGKRLSFDPIPVDEEEHRYSFVREGNAAIIRMDGREVARASLEGLKMPFAPVAVYNESEDGVVEVEEIEMALTPEDQAHIALFQPAKRQFQLVRYKEAGTLSAEALATARHGCIVFQRVFTDHLFSNSLPRQGEVAPAFKAYVTPGEREPILVGIHATRKVDKVAVSVSELKAASGASIPSGSIAVRTVSEIPKRHLYNFKWSPDYSQMPMLLEAGRPFPLAENATRGVLLDVHIPEGARGGIYKGAVIVNIDGEEIEHPIEVEVYPFQLSKPAGMFFGAYTRMFQPQMHGTAEAYLREMAESGMTTVGYCNTWAKVKRNGDDLAVEFDPFYIEAMEYYRKLGFPEALIQLSDPALAYAQQQAGWGKPGFDEAYLQGAKALHEAMKNRGVPEMFLQPVDEPGWRGESVQQMNTHLLRLLKKQGLFKTEQDGPADSYFIDDAGPYADMWVVNGTLPPPEVIRKAQAEGKKVVIYNTDVEAWRPIVTRYTAGYLQWKFGLDGALQWEFQGTAPAGKAYSEGDDDDSENAYMAFYYPPYKGNSGGPTISWIGFREGIDDYRYLLTLRDRIEAGRAKNQALAEEIEGNLNALIDSLQPGRRVRNQGTWSEKGQDADGKFIKGYFNLDNGWSPADYDARRQQIARWIMELEAL